MLFRSNVNEIPTNMNSDQKSLLEKAALKNVFVFGEDPIGTSMDKNTTSKWFENLDFMVVQDYFMTETTQQANLILPAAFPVESEGSFTNTQKVIQKFEKGIPSKIEMDNCQQLIGILNTFGQNGLKDTVDVMMEAISLLPIQLTDDKHAFVSTSNDKTNRMFNNGCDFLVQYFEEAFKSKF